MSVVQYTKETGGNPDYYNAYTTTNLYVEKAFGGYLSTLNITNLSATDDVQFSFDGATLAGDIPPGESATINVDQRSSVYVKGTAGGGVARLWGYVNMRESKYNVLTGSDGTAVVVNSDGSINVAPAYGLHPVVNKFGAAPDFDTGDGAVTVWDGAEDGAVWELMNYVYSTTAAIDSISSTDAGDSQDIELQGLDANYDLAVQTVTLNGTTRVALTTNLIRVFRAKNVGSTNLTGHVIVYENDTTADDAGVPDDSNLIRCVVHPENNQTEMAVYTIPDGYTGYLKEVYVHSAGASRSAEYLYRINVRPFGQVFQLKYRGTFADDVDLGDTHNFAFPMSIPAKADIELTCEVLTAVITGATVIGGFDIELVAD